MEKEKMNTGVVLLDELFLTDVLSKSLVDENVYNHIKKTEFSECVDKDSECKIKSSQNSKLQKNSQNLKKISSFKHISVPKYNKLQILKSKSLTEWIEIIFAVSPFIGHMVEFVDGLVDKMAIGSFSSSQKCGGTFNVFEKVIDVVQRKHELVNLELISQKFYEQISTDEEKEVVETTLDKTRKIVEIAENGKYKWVYRARDKFLRKIVELCRLSSWDEEFFFNHFGSEPLIQYYV